MKDKGEKKGPHVFGIRHLSPAGAYYVRRFLDEISPELVLIEGPSDFTELIGDLKDPEVKPPVAVMAYTEELPVRTILYPFAVYSPEYQAILWPGSMGVSAGSATCLLRCFLELRSRGGAGNKGS